jgi:RNA polymerase sigma-70 factor (ECF subfamily)
MLHAANVASIEHAMRDLPDRFRELLVLRELEGLSYQELADVLGIPLGTVMSGLARARHALRRALTTQLRQRDHTVRRNDGVTGDWRAAQARRCA